MIRIDVLPDDVLLEIFDFYMDVNPSYSKIEIESWQLLVHVCRRWRSLVFGSPRRLNLRLVCTPKTPTSDTLDVWPALPLLIRGNMNPSPGVDNIIAALGQNNRVCEVFLSGLADRESEKVLGAMRVPFPELSELWFSSHDSGTPPVAPDSFLGGSAPQLRTFQLSGIPFPGLPKLLLSTTHLVLLFLSNIPHSGYISPEEMVALLSVLSSLQRFHLKFQSPQSRPASESRRPRPPKRSVIPSLNYFKFKGAIEYLEDLVTFIDAPQLCDLDIDLFNQVDFDGPRLAQFISRTPTFGAHDEALVILGDTAVSIELKCRASDGSPPLLMIGTLCSGPVRQLSSVAQICNSCLPFLSRVEDLYIQEHLYSQLVWNYDAIDNTIWLEFLLPFHSVKTLSIRGLGARYRDRPPRNRRDRGVAQPTEDFCRGAQAIGTFGGFPGKYWAVHCSTRTLRSLHHHFCLE